MRWFTKQSFSRASEWEEEIKGGLGVTQYEGRIYLAGWTFEFTAIRYSPASTATAVATTICDEALHFYSYKNNYRRSDARCLIFCGKARSSFRPMGDLLDPRVELDLIRCTKSAVCVKRIAWKGNVIITKKIKEGKRREEIYGRGHTSRLKQPRWETERRMSSRDFCKPCKKWSTQERGR